MIFYRTAADFLRLIAARVNKVEGTGKCYLGLCTAAPSADGSSINEISSADYPSYERIQLNVFTAQEYTNVWGDPANGTISNIKPFSGNSQCMEEGGWPECPYWCLFDDKTGGNPMVADVFCDPDGEIDPTTGLYPQTTLKVEYKKVPVFRKGALQLTLK